MAHSSYGYLYTMYQCFDTGINSDILISSLWISHKTSIQMCLLSRYDDSELYPPLYLYQQLDKNIGRFIKEIQNFFMVLEILISGVTLPLFVVFSSKLKVWVSSLIATIFRWSRDTLNWSQWTQNHHKMVRTKNFDLESRYVDTKNSKFENFHRWRHSNLVQPKMVRKTKFGHKRTE